MKRKRLKRDPRVLVAVTWQDANATATAIYNRVRDHTPTEMVTVGWLVDLDKSGLSICCERFIDGGEYVYRGHTFIPSGIVTRVRRLQGDV